MFELIGDVLLQIVLLPVSLIVFAGMCWVMLSILEALGSMIGRALGISLDQYERFVELTSIEGRGKGRA